MQSAGLTTVAIHANTISAARKQNSDLFQVVKRDVSMILVSLEQLRSKGFEKLTQSSVFVDRLWMMAVDEAHLMNTWGQSFRKDFQQNGWA